MEDPGGVEPLAHGLKARCPTVSGLNAPGPCSCRCGGEPLRFFDGHAGSPVSDVGSPAPYRTAVFRLSAGRSAFELREKIGARSRTRTWGCRCVRPMPWPLGEASVRATVGGAIARKQEWCTREDLNLHALRRPLLRRLRLPFRHECIAKVELMVPQRRIERRFPPYQSGALPLDDCG